MKTKLAGASPVDQPVRPLACPACGDKTAGFEYRMTEVHIMCGAWGGPAEAGDHTGIVSQSLVECAACKARFQLATLTRRGLVA